MAICRRRCVIGFLDHSTNNIIIDAVLTDAGRQMLANNQGNFKLAFFSMGDDEVDYSTIEKFGRAVGKEKIAKNTPIFEAQTLGSLAMKHRLLTLPDPTVTRLPKITLGGDIVGNLLSFTRPPGVSTRDVSVTQEVEGNVVIPDGLSDVTFSVQVPDRFLKIKEASYISLEATTRIATYFIARSSVTNANGAKASFTLELQSGLDNTVFSIYGNSGDKTKISSVVSVIGDQSGFRKDFSIQISTT